MLLAIAKINFYKIIWLTISTLKYSCMEVLNYFNREEQL